MLSILSKLKEKKPVEKNKGVKLKLRNPPAKIKAKIIDKRDSNFPASEFRKKMKIKRKMTSIIDLKESEKSKVNDSIDTMVEEKETSTQPSVQSSAQPSVQPSAQPSVQSSIQPSVQSSAQPSVQIQKISKIKLTLPGESKQKTRRSTLEKVKRKTKEITFDTVLEVDPREIIYDDKPLAIRLPEQPKSQKVSKYFQNNREIFINFVNNLFEPYKKQIELQLENKITCLDIQKMKKKQFVPMPHQNIVKDYINTYTPYRGILIYHGLGAGKTCASIGIAEGMKHDKEVVIMTPASLQKNYREQLTTCGDFFYKKNQFWEFMNTSDNPHLEEALSQILSLDRQYIRKKGGAWMVNVKKKSNYESLKQSPDKLESLNNQITKMIENKYKFINYNGIRKTKIKELEEQALRKYGTKNFFSHKVIVVDEAHNLISRIINKIKSKDSDLISNKLYEYLLDADDCKIVFLSGTPIINYPNELAILFNILRGYIKTYHISIKVETSKKKIDLDYFKNKLKKYNLIDYIDYDRSKKKLIVTRNMFGFVNYFKAAKYEGVYKHLRGEKDDNKFLYKLYSILEDNETGEKEITVEKKLTEVIKNKALPENEKEFKDMFFVNEKEFKNELLFKRRIIGLTSYFRSAQEQLMPRFDADKHIHIVNVEMSNYQLEMYEKARVAERREKKQKKMEDDNETSSSYRVFSRSFCNFVFPPNIKRPMPEISVKVDKWKPKRGDKIIYKKDGKWVKAVVYTVESEQITIKLQDGSKEVVLKENITNSNFRLNKISADMQAEMELADTNIGVEMSDSRRRNAYSEKIKKTLKQLSVDADNIFSPEKLEIYSPKFLQVLRHLLDDETYKGSHLIYSQFKTLEGIGILKLILDYNGFAQFKLKKTSGVWVLDIPDEDMDKPKYALYTGDENEEEKEVIRKIFNNDFKNINDTLRKQIIKINTNNKYGEVIKALMITSSGAEGINLRNVRYVHIIEPYWHPVRTEQIIGRARRICSHEDLPIDERTVDVYIYLMEFTKIQMEGDKTQEKLKDREPLCSRELLIKDLSKFGTNLPVTSDQALYEISTIKQNINNTLLKWVKESSIDCSIHSEGKEGGLTCYNYTNLDPRLYSYKPNYKEEQKDDIVKKNIKKITWKASKITIKGVDYALRKDKKYGIGLLYTLEDYQRAVRGSLTNLVPKAKLVKNSKGKIVKKAL
tara:strand:+ start:1666 stop:5244 length:3579 start_codon:yes stop_codon:yes gene_type:complete